MIACGMLVKNEEDIIEHNIKYHFKKGIDKFFIIDNGSSDGTFEKIKNLSKEIPIYLERRDPGYFNQGEWINDLFEKAKNEKFSFFFPNDADDFLYGDYDFHYLKKITKDITQIKRFDVLPEENKNFLEFDKIITNYSVYRKFGLIKPRVKIFVKINEIVSIPGGYHYAILKNKKKNKEIYEFSKQYKNGECLIIHYNFRSKEKLKNKLNSKRNYHLIKKYNYHYLWDNFQIDEIWSEVIQIKDIEVIRPLKDFLNDNNKK